MIKMPVCVLCENYIGENNESDPKKLKAFCKAFPDGDGIPDVFEMWKKSECANGFAYKDKQGIQGFERFK